MKMAAVCQASVKKCQNRARFNLLARTDNTVAFSSEWIKIPIKIWNLFLRRQPNPKWIKNSFGPIKIFFFTETFQDFHWFPIKLFTDFHHASKVPPNNTTKRGTRLEMDRGCGTIEVRRLPWLLEHGLTCQDLVNTFGRSHASCWSGERRRCLRTL